MSRSRCDDCGVFIPAGYETCEGECPMNMSRCVDCGAYVPGDRQTCEGGCANTGGTAPGQKHCPDCGNFLPEGHATCPGPCGAAHCEKCGTPIPHGETYCSERCARTYHVDPDEYLDSIRALADELGSTPTTTEYTLYGRFSTTPARTHFGGWNAALEAAGLATNKEWGITDTELIDDVTAVIEDLGHVPSKTEYNDIGTYSTTTLRTRFGSWSAAILEAGYTPNKYGPQIGAELLELDPDDVGLSPVGERPEVTQGD